MSWPLAASLAFVGPTARARCDPPPHLGTWIAHPTRGILARLEVRFLCQDAVINGVPHPIGAPHTLAVWVPCGADRCGWGEVTARFDGTGYAATYHEGHATHTLEVRASRVYPGELYVSLFVDAHDGGPDVWRSGYMVRTDVAPRP